MYVFPNEISVIHEKKKKNVNFQFINMVKTLKLDKAYSQYVHICTYIRVFTLAAIANSEFIKNVLTFMPFSD